MEKQSVSRQQLEQDSKHSQLPWSTQLVLNVHVDVKWTKINIDYGSLKTKRRPVEQKPQVVRKKKLALPSITLGDLETGILPWVTFRGRSRCGNEVCCRITYLLNDLLIYYGVIVITACIASHEHSFPCREAHTHPINLRCSVQYPDNTVNS